MTDQPHGPSGRPPLSDRWHSREFPVLLEAARALDVGQAVDPGTIATALGTETSEVQAALSALVEARYLHKHRPQADDPSRQRLAWRVFPDWYELAERGRRAVGLWPSGESADTLVDLLRKAEDLTEDPEEKTLIRRASGALGSVSREVLTDVLAAVARSQIGI